MKKDNQIQKREIKDKSLLPSLAGIVLVFFFVYKLNSKYYKGNL